MMHVDVETGIVYGKRGRPVGSLDSAGYVQIDLRSSGGGIVSAHRLIWESAHGPIPDRLEINHRNGIKTDNRITNLELLTHADNIRHAYRTGLKSNAGERHPSHKLSESDVREIRALHAGGRSKQLLARQFGVHRRTINGIVLGHAWREVV